MLRGLRYGLWPSDFWLPPVEPVGRAAPPPRCSARCWAAVRTRLLCSIPRLREGGRAPPALPENCRCVGHRREYGGGVMKLEEIAMEASKLSEEERASLASRLLHGLETPIYEVSDDEVARRMREADADPSALVTFDELVAGLDRRGS